MRYFVWYTFKGEVGAQASPESSSDAGFDEAMDLSCGKDSFTRYCYKGEKLCTFVFVVQMLVLVWDTPGLMLPNLRGCKITKTKVSFIGLIMKLHFGPLLPLFGTHTML